MARLVIVGDGPTRGECETLIEKLGIAPAVHLLGHRHDIPSILAALDVVALPSKREGFPFAVLEAMAAGKPTVAFNLPGLSQLIEHERTGLLVEPGDNRALAAAIVQVLHDPSLAERMAAAAMERVKDFGIDAHVDRLVSLYQNIARPASSQPIHCDAA